MTNVLDPRTKETRIIETSNFPACSLHEPGHSSSSSFSSSTTHPVWTFSRTRRTTRTRTNQFMVPRRVRKQMEPLHEPGRSRREEALISLRELVSLLKSAPTKNREGSWSQGAVARQ